MSYSTLASLNLHANTPEALPRIGIVLLDAQRRTALGARVEARGLSAKQCSSLVGDCTVRMAGTGVDAKLTEDSNLQMVPSLPAGQQTLMTNIGANRALLSLSYGIRQWIESLRN